ncbi:hypothetical protein EST38_g9493 [Candolleomyces aberdarensis]|uniref:Uncharacterized protein n=1 Tax=Candolleomyces aberdarensis TaxID=2316362 RepID=A0A4Q2DAG4_9AGAR|nr:hypothetical protein EST38_g9493 [Candolleomyces aberdarensis]
MTSSRATYLPLTEQTFPQEHLSLLEAYQRRSSWIWTTEVDPYTAPNSPSGEQRGFRFTYLHNDPNKIPSNATIVIAVDNYFALYINGAIVHEADPRNDLFAALAFSVPLQTPSNKTVFAVRAINGRNAPPTQNPAGLLTALKINFQGSGGSEVLVSGPDTKWVGESLLAPGWEETNFDDGSWQTAVVYPSAIANTPWPPDRRSSPLTIAVGAKLTPPQAVVQNSTVGPGSDDNLQPGAWAGIVVGAALLAAALAAIATFFFTRRRYQPKKRESTASSSYVAYVSVPPTIQTTPYPSNHVHQEQVNSFTQGPEAVERGDYPPAYMGSENAAGSTLSTSARSSEQYPPRPRYQVHHASVHKSSMSGSGLTNR